MTMRYAFNGSIRGRLIEFAHAGAWLRLPGGETRLVVYAHLDPVGFKPAKKARATAVPKPKLSPKAKKTTAPKVKLNRPERIQRDTRSDLARHAGSLESIGKATVSK